MVTVVDKHITEQSLSRDVPVADVDDFNKDAALARNAIAAKIAQDAESVYFGEHKGAWMVRFYRKFLELLDGLLETLFMLSMTDSNSLAAFLSCFLPLVITILASGFFDSHFHVNSLVYVLASFFFIVVFGVVFFSLVVSSLCINECGVFGFSESGKSTVSGFVFLQVSRADSDDVVDAVLPLANVGRALSRMFFVHRSLRVRADGYSVWEVSVDESLLGKQKEFGSKVVFSDNILAKNEDQVLEFEGRIFKELVSSCFSEARLAWLNKVPFMRAEDAVLRKKNGGAGNEKSVSVLHGFLISCVLLFTTKSFFSLDRVVGDNKSWLGFVFRFVPVLLFCLYIGLAVLAWCAISLVAGVFMMIAGVLGKRAMHGQYYRD